jgi:hypothetical protein
MPVDSDEFHLEEFKQLRDEVVSTMAKAEAMLQYAVLIAAAVFGWLVTQTLGQQNTGELCTKLPPRDLPLSLLVWWIPCIAVLVLGMIGGARFLRVKEAGQYLRRIEDHLGAQRLGWEKFLASKRATVAAVSILAWLLLAVCTTYVAAAMPPQLRTLPACIARQ